MSLRSIYRNDFMTKKFMLVVALFIIVCLGKTACFAEYQYELSICTIFRDEAPYLKEWIEFHRMLGVQHFYLCSHASKDNYKEVLKRYIARGIVELKEVEDATPDAGLHRFMGDFQCSFFTETLVKARGISKWVAFIDADEFLVPVKHNSLLDLLQNYEEFGSVSANWQMFGTSGIPKLDDKKLMIEQLVRCAPVNNSFNNHIKSIVQPERTERPGNPHWFIHVDNYQQVNTDKVPFSGPFSPYIQVDQLRINHYWTRDKHYLNTIKIPRQISFGNTAEETYKRNDEFNQTVDLSIQKFVRRLRKKMKLD